MDNTRGPQNTIQRLAARCSKIYVDVDLDVLDRAFAPGWDDPGMDDYDRYEELRP